MSMSIKHMSKDNRQILKQNSFFIGNFNGSLSVIFIGLID